MRATKMINGERFRLESPRAFHAMSEDLYVWAGSGDRAAYLSEDEETKYGVKGYRGMLTHPVT